MNQHQLNASLTKLSELENEIKNSIEFDKNNDDKDGENNDVKQMSNQNTDIDSDIDIDIVFACVCGDVRIHLKICVYDVCVFIIESTNQVPK